MKRKMSEYDELKELKSINKMWTIIKVDLKNLEFLKNEFKKVGEDVKIYSPKL